MISFMPNDILNNECSVLFSQSLTHKKKYRKEIRKKNNLNIWQDSESVSSKCCFWYPEYWSSPLIPKNNPYSLFSWLHMLTLLYLTGPPGHFIMNDQLWLLLSVFFSFSLFFFALASSKLYEDLMVWNWSILVQCYYFLSFLNYCPDLLDLRWLSWFDFGFCYEI